MIRCRHIHLHQHNITGSACNLTINTLSLYCSTSTTLFAVSQSNTIATPLSFTIPPEYTTLYPLLSKSPHSFHLTSLIPNTFSPFLFISFFTFSNFPSTFIILTFHVPILSVPSLVLGSGYHIVRCLS